MGGWYNYGTFERERKEGLFKGNPKRELHAIESFEWEGLGRNVQSYLSRRRKFLLRAIYRPTRRQELVGVKRGRLPKRLEDIQKSFEIADKIRTSIDGFDKMLERERHEAILLEMEWRYTGEEDQRIDDRDKLWLYGDLQLNYYW